MVSIPRRLYDRVREEVEKSGGSFATPDEYIAFVLDEVFGRGREKEQGLSKGEEDQVNRHLRDLGYS